jgi:hypothetical protein
MSSKFKYALSLIVLVAISIRVSGIMNIDDDDDSLFADHWEYVEFIVPKNDITPASPHTEKIFVCYPQIPELFFTITAKPVLHCVETRTHSPPSLFACL